VIQQSTEKLLIYLGFQGEIPFQMDPNGGASIAMSMLDKLRATLQCNPYRSTAWRFDAIRIDSSLPSLPGYTMPARVAVAGVA
jgi:hypothetical protein